MKKVIFVLVVLLLTVNAMAEVKVYCGIQPWLGSGVAEPAWAGVDVESTYVGNQPWKPKDLTKVPVWDPNIVRIYYDASTETNRVRAFGLTIELVDTIGAVNAVIDSVTAAHVGESVTGSLGYGIFPGTIVIDGNGVVSDYGTPVAVNDTPGAENTGLGTKKIVVELGSLYEDANYPATSGLLLTLNVNNKACAIVITENVHRGGVVMEDPDEVVDVNLPGAIVLCPGDIQGARDGNPWDGRCVTADFMKAKNQLAGYTYKSADICGARNVAPDGTTNTQDFMKCKQYFLAGTDWQ